MPRRSTLLQEKPSLILGQQHVAQLLTAFPTAALPMHSLGVKRINDLKKLASTCQHLGLDRAAQRMLKYFIHGGHSPVALPRFLAHQLAPSAPSILNASCPFFEHLPAVSFCMRVKDERRRKIEKNSTKVLDPSWESREACREEGGGD